MICLIPISRFRIAFEIGAGRPFSQLEQMVLRAIKEGVTDLDRMQASFQIHPRILIEALVTLTQAGWVSLSGQEGGGFLLTSEGAKATEDTDPPSTTVVSSKRAFVLLERLTGGLIANQEVRFSSRNQLESVWEEAIRLRAAFHENSIDEGQVRQFLPRRQGEWVRWIGPIDMMSRDAHWIPVGVDTVAGTLVGLPDQWRALGPVILEEARSREDTLSEGARSKQWVVDGELSDRAREGSRLNEGSSSSHSLLMELSESDLVFGGKEHESTLTTALADAVSSVFLASAFLSKPAIEALEEPLMQALRRGVNVDLLWGDAAGSDHGDSALDALKKIAYEARRGAHKGVVRFNHGASGSHAKLLLFDKPTGMEACLGSYNWLSPFDGTARNPPYDVSVRLCEPGLVAELCRCVAGLWAGGQSEALSSTADRWRSMAGELERDAAKESRDGSAQSVEVRDTSVRLIFDREHEAVMREWSATTQDRFFVFSHRLGSAAESRLLRSGESDPSLFTVVYGHSELDNEWLSKVEGVVRRVGGTIVRLPQVHAKVLVSDASACISSYNFLSADPFGTTRRARELGVVLEGGQVATWLSEHLARAIQDERAAAH